jgi:glycosyltransferase involved in cell wall biosynthesis
MRLALLTSEPAGTALGSGTAVALRRLRSALALLGVEAPVLRAGPSMLGATAARWRFNRALSPRLLDGYDAVLGVNGDGWRVAERLRVPFIALIKAFYAGALVHERLPARGLLAAHARWESAGARRATLVIAPSRFAADRVVDAYAVDRATVRVIPEAFDAPAWRAMLPHRARHGSRVLCVARLYPRKRVIDLLDAWPMVRAALPDARLDVVGGGPELHRLVHRSRGLRGCFLHGHVEHPATLEFYARADAFCLPSLQETFGYAAVEAMASGLPLVVAAAGALPEVCDGTVTQLVAPRCPPALAAAIVRSLDARARERAAIVNPPRADAFAPQLVAGQTMAAVREAVELLQRRASGRVWRRAGSRRYASTTSRICSGPPASESAK